MASGCAGLSACSNLMSFREGVDTVLDVVNALGSLITDMSVADVRLGVVDLYATVGVVAATPLSHIKLSIVV